MQQCQGGGEDWVLRDLLLGVRAQDPRRWDDDGEDTCDCEYALPRASFQHLYCEPDY